MTFRPIDVALIQPMVHQLESWLTVRRRLSGCFDQEGARLAAVPGASVHLKGIEGPSFDRSLEGVDTIVGAYPVLLGQCRDFPCASIPLTHTAKRVVERLDEAPKGFDFTNAAVHLILGKDGGMAVVHLLSGLMSPDEFEPEWRVPQRELRLWYRGLIEDRSNLFSSALEASLTPFLGRELAEGAATALEPSVGHVVTFGHHVSKLSLEVLGRAHLIEEGLSDNQGEMLIRNAKKSEVFAHFGWSQSTIVTDELGVSYRLLFPLIGVNHAWYRYRQLRRDVIDMSRAIHTLETDRDLIAQTEFYNQVVLDVKVWEAERESFERGLKPVYRSVYNHLWSYWDTGESRATVHEGIDYLRDFLDRKYSVKFAKRESTQAKILFVIAIFQLLSVFGIVSGYLYFWEQTSLPETVIFESRFTVWAVLLSPIAVTALIVWLLVGFFRRHR